MLALELNLSMEKNLYSFILVKYINSINIIVIVLVKTDCH